MLEIHNNDKLINEIDELYQEIWGYSLKEQIVKHLNYKGFRGIYLLSEDGETAGFIYGYSSLPGQYYHELMSKEFDEEQYEIWLRDAYELPELAVASAYRNQGYAKLLVNELVKNVNHRTAVLTAQVDNEPARSLYQGLGWEVVKESFSPRPNSTPYVIMGKRLK